MNLVDKTSGPVNPMPRCLDLLPGAEMCKRSRKDMVVKAPTKVKVKVPSREIVISVDDGDTELLSVALAAKAA